jgi:hypothetical protein
MIRCGRASTPSRSPQQWIFAAPRHIMSSETLFKLLLLTNYIQSSVESHREEIIQCIHALFSRPLKLSNVGYSRYLDKPFLGLQLVLLFAQRCLHHTVRPGSRACTAILPAYSVWSQHKLTRLRDATQQLSKIKPTRAILAIFGGKTVLAGLLLKKQ